MSKKVKIEGKIPFYEEYNKLAKSGARFFTPEEETALRGHKEKSNSLKGIRNVGTTYQTVYSSNTFDTVSTLKDARVKAGGFYTDSYEPTIGYNPQSDTDFIYGEDEPESPYNGVVDPITTDFNGNPMEQEEKTSALNDFYINVPSSCSMLFMCHHKKGYSIIPALMIDRLNREGDEYIVVAEDNKLSIVKSKNFVKRFISMEIITNSRDVINHIFFNVLEESGEQIPYIRGNKRVFDRHITLYSDFNTTFRRRANVNTAISNNSERCLKPEVDKIIREYDLSKDGELLPGSPVICFKYDREFEGTILETNIPGNHGICKVLTITGEVIIINNKDVKPCLQ